MSQWISIKEAAEKFDIDQAYIQLWVDMEVIISYYENNTTYVYEGNVRTFIDFGRMQGSHSSYVYLLEKLCIKKIATCDTYAMLLGARDKEIALYREAKAQCDRYQAMHMLDLTKSWKSSIEYLSDHNLLKYWLKKLRVRIKYFYRLARIRFCH